MRTALVTLWVALGLAASVQGEVHRVQADGSGDYPTIQAAVDAAADGDVVELGSGRFRGAGNRDVDLSGKQITIRSASRDPYSCVISPEGSASQHHRGFVLQSGEGRSVILEGFTVTGGLSDRGGGIYCLGASPTIRNCVFLGNGATGSWSGVGGGGLSCDDGAAPLIEDCVFQENVSNWGGGLHAFQSAPELENCSFERNSALMGGGAWLDFSSTATIADCEFRENEASSMSGGMMCSNGTSASLLNASFIDNSCGFKGGGLSLYSSGPVYMTSCLFQGNSAIKGGALHCDACGNSPIQVEHCTFVTNSADSLGGAVFCRLESSVGVVGCTFYGNSAAEGAVAAVETGATATFEQSILSFSPIGGSVYCADGSGIALSCSDVYQNAGGDWIGCIAGQLGMEGNICADPMFCDPEAGDFSLDASSPCVGGQTPEECGQMGAAGVGCGLAGVPAGPAWSEAGLCRAYPNPSAQGVWVSYLSGLEPHGVALRVVDASGRLVSSLGAARSERGQTQTYWDGRSQNGRLVPGGVYYLEVTIGGRNSRQKIVVVR